MNQMCIRDRGEGIDKLRRLCREHGVREEVADRALSRISGNQNLSLIHI